MWSRAGAALRVSFLLPLLAPLLACAPRAAPAARAGERAGERAVPVLEPQRSGTTALLQAVSAVDARVVWVSGHLGTFARTLDGGATWRAGRVAGADTLQFRDVHAVSADTAYLMSAGNGELSRIYRTVDGGESWTMQFVNRDSAAFYDCFAFWTPERGVAFSDAWGGRHVLRATADGGASWTLVEPERLPAPLANEGGFAASGTCVATVGMSAAWVGTGNARPARVLRTTDGGRSWTAAAVPVTSGDAAGITSVAFRDSSHGVALGGEIGRPGARGDYVAVTRDGGRSWTPGGRLRLAGAAYGGAYVPGAPTPSLVAVGPGGADLSTDEGRTWRQLDTLAYWSVGFAPSGDGWAVGPGGRIVKLRVF